MAERVQISPDEVHESLAAHVLTDGMKLAPANPTFIQSRNAIIAADQVKDLDDRDVRMRFIGAREVNQPLGGLQSEDHLIARFIRGRQNHRKSLDASTKPLDQIGNKRAHNEEVEVPEAEIKRSSWVAGVYLNRCDSRT